MSYRRAFALAACLAIGGGLSACRGGGEGGLHLTGAWARPAGAGETTAVYLTIANEGNESDVLTGVDCSIAAMCELHETRLEGDIVHMEHLDRLEIPAGGQVSLEPGGTHLMLMDLRSDLAPGDQVSLMFHFEVAGEIPVEAEVVAP
jgi:copper(I)-binding protein